MFRASIIIRNSIEPCLIIILFLLPVIIGALEFPNFPYNAVVKTTLTAGKVLAFVTLIVYLCQWRWKLRVQPVFASFIAFVGTLIFLGHQVSVLMAVLQAISMLSMGFWIGKLFDVRTDWILRVIIGYIAYTIMVTVLNYLKILNVEVVVLLNFSLLLIFPWRDFLQQLTPLSKESRKVTDQAVHGYILVLALSVGAFWGLLTAVPDNGSDSINAYRLMILEILNQGGNKINPSETSIGLISLPGLWSQASAVLLANGDIHAAKVWNALILILGASVLTNCLQTQTNCLQTQKAQISFIAVLFVLTTPIVTRLLLAPFLDIHAIFMVAAIVYFVKLISQIQKEISWKIIILTGIILGVAILTKYTLFFMIAPTLLVFFGYWTIQKGIKISWKLIVSGFIGAMLVSSYMFFVWKVSGNPTFPFYNKVWHAPYMPIENIILTASGFHSGFVDWKLFWIMTTDTPRYSVVGAKEGTLGIGFWVGFISTTILCISEISKTRRLGWQAVLGICFIISTVLLSAVQNADRYIIPLLLLALPAVYNLLLQTGRNWSVIISSTLLFIHISLAHQYGNGAGSFDASLVFKETHEATKKTHRPRQFLADTLNKEFGDKGSFLLLGKNGGLLGDVYNNSWYDMASASEISKIILNPESTDKFVHYLADHNMDVIIMSSQMARRLFKTLGNERFKLLLNTFDAVSSRTKTLGYNKLWYVKDEIRFEKINNLGLPSFIDTNNFVNFTSPYMGDIKMEIDLRCDGMGEVLQFRSENGWHGKIYRDHICAGSFETITFPLREVKSGRLIVQLRNFSNLEVIKATASVK